jgi:hypothetical protein
MLILVSILHHLFPKLLLNGLGRAICYLPLGSCMVDADYLFSYFLPSMMVLDVWDV